MYFLTVLITATPGHASSDAGREALRTPYDAKYQKVELYLTSTQQGQPRNAVPSYRRQLSRVRRYLTLAQHFTFQMEGMRASGVQEDHWQLPDETENLGTGDCEDLAIWLYCQLLAEGISNIRLTLGFAGSDENRAMHAWVTWYKRGKMVILDPSRRKGMYTADPLDPVTYQPCYSYCLDKRWLHQ
jgi:predicted transglutaminase-like cysteine proteinase